MNDKISVIIPWHDSGCTHRWHNMGTVWMAWMKLLRTSDEIVIGRNDDEPFNRSAARNKGAREARGDLLIFADADTLFTSSVVLAYLEMTGRGYQHDWMIPHTVYFNADAKWSAQFLGRPDFTGSGCVGAVSMGLLTYEHRIENSVGGVVMVKREAYEAVHGYDERFKGWAYEDDAFAASLTTLFGKPPRIEGGEVVHLWHPHPHEANFGQPFIEHNRALIRRYDDACGNVDAMRAIVEGH